MTSVAHLRERDREEQTMRSNANPLCLKLYMVGVAVAPPPSVAPGATIHQTSPTP